ncbi:hypothetical protein BDZ91DRAFT_734397, partial [Kalaharituber pfeilii]
MIEKKLSNNEQSGFWWRGVWSVLFFPNLPTQPPLANIFFFYLFIFFIVLCGPSTGYGGGGGG